MSLSWECSAFTAAICSRDCWLAWTLGSTPCTEQIPICSKSLSCPSSEAVFSLGYSSPTDTGQSALSRHRASLWSCWTCSRSSTSQRQAWTVSHLARRRIASRRGSTLLRGQDCEQRWETASQACFQWSHLSQVPRKVWTSEGLWLFLS